MNKRDTFFLGAFMWLAVVSGLGAIVILSLNAFSIGMVFVTVMLASVAGVVYYYGDRIGV